MSKSINKLASEGSFKEAKIMSNTSKARRYDPNNLISALKNSTSDPIKASARTSIKITKAITASQ